MVKIMLLVFLLFLGTLSVSAQSASFTKLIFDKYGQADELTEDGLHKLLKNIGLGAENDHTHHHVKAELAVSSSYGTTGTTSGSSPETRSKRDTNIFLQPDKCFSAHDYMHIVNKTERIEAKDFSAMCPALITQLDLRVCNDHSHATHAKSIADLSYKTWLWSIGAMLVICLVGLGAVGVVPLMRHVFYNHVLQFLVALAVGSLTGDALLHLLPHAMQSMAGDSHSHDDESHKAIERKTVLLGLVAQCCLLFFFLLERLLTVCQQLRATDHPRERKEEGCETTQLTGRGDVCRNNTEMVVHHTRAARHLACNERQQREERRCVKRNSEHLDRLSHSEHDSEHGHAHNHDDVTTDVATDEEAFVVPEPKVSHLSHGHTHGPLPHSLSAVVCMVILGDGLHNFADGIAIGAAFGSSITAGLSTSIAVFCHELPHELGDFAMLMKAGMTVRKGICYNLFSSLLSVIGLIVGLAIGSVENSTSWIFAAVAGSFLYIALVDMMPQLSLQEPHKKENPCVHLIIQLIAFVTGSIIMLVIALYEHDIRLDLDI